MTKNKQHILLVDDDHNLLLSLKKLLSLKGYESDTALGGEDAICQLNKKEYDLVLLDLHMPDVNGYDVMQHIKSDTNKPAIVIISGETSFEAARKACSGGSYAFLSKPYNIDELFSPVKNALKEMHHQKQNLFMQKQL